MNHLLTVWLLTLACLAPLRAADQAVRQTPLRETETYRVMTYNLENYLLAPTATRKAKSPAARAKVAESILAGRPDILAVQEIGDVAALLDLQDGLRARGLDLPFWEHCRGWDTNIFTGVLSRYPILRRRAHTNESYLLKGRRWHLSRGIAEVEIAVTPGYRLTLMVAHLKSKRAIAEASESEIREQEAGVLRELIETHLRTAPASNLIVCGDLNDTRDTSTLRTIAGTREPRLFDPRPAESNGDAAPSENPRFEPRRITWTHYFGKEDSYSRLDYLLLSRGLKREWRSAGSRVVVVPDWGLASDHRPVLCEFSATDH